MRLGLPGKDSSVTDTIKKIIDGDNTVEPIYLKRGDKYNLGEIQGCVIASGWTALGEFDLDSSLLHFNSDREYVAATWWKTPLYDPNFNGVNGAFYGGDNREGGDDADDEVMRLNL